ncbi:MAG TPA: dienelactone hydrolase family protein, partial [Fluviicoccus sp.]|nr:dienelactone hydrolase family protein [Fluviicoccus sp.]
GKDVTYNGGGVSMKGYIVYDDQFKGKRPAVLVVHEWWGLNDYARSRADQLAKAGYVAMAVDMYGDGKSANHPDNAMAFMQEATKDTEQTTARFRAAEKLLKANKHSNGKKLAAIGYCFGGAVVLNMARQGEPLKGVASFHGALGAWKPAEPGKVTPKVLVMTGADDNMVPAEAVAKFDEEMKAAKADYRIISYPGAKHSFTNPGADDIAKKFGMPIAYNAEADKASWAELQAFLKDIFK